VLRIEELNRAKYRLMIMIRRRFLLAASLVIGSAVLGPLSLVAPQPAVAQDMIHFTTPSKNIDCLLYPSDFEFVASCIVKTAEWTNAPDRPADCDLDWSPTDVYLASEVRGKRVTNAVGVGGCRGDIGPICGPGCRTLGYGKSVKLASITCTSATTGVTCVTTKGRRTGFVISRAAYRLIR
jgi:hypothetical protein